MEDIAEVLDDEKVDEFMEYCICILLRWKIVAQRYGFSTSEIDNFESVMKMFNLYSPATRILNEYKWQFPLDNFDKIRDFIIINFEMNVI